MVIFESTVIAKKAEEYRYNQGLNWYMHWPKCTVRLYDRRTPNCDLKVTNFN